jgi:hypothetical protein
MFQFWQCTLRVLPGEVRLLLTAPSGDLLKARLAPRPSHPRALLTLLEGLSLWAGAPLQVALSVDESCRGLHDSMLFGDELWPAESSLVKFDVAARAGRRARLRGLGDFRALRARRPT